MAWDLDIESFTALPSALGMTANGAAPSGWSVAGGVLTGVTAAINYWAYVGPNDSADRTVEIECKVNGNPGGVLPGSTFGQWLQIGNQTRYIDIGFYAAKIQVNDNGVNFDLPFDMTVWRKVRATIAGTTFTLYVDGLPIYSRTINRLFANAACLFGQGTAATSGNWNVRALRVNVSAALAPPINEPNYAATLLALGPRAYWKMDEGGGLFADSAPGAAWTMTPAGVALAQTPPIGPFGSAAHWAGAAYARSGITLGDLHTVTLTAWISYDDLANGKIIWEYTANSNVGNASNPAGFYFLQDTFTTGNEWILNLGPNFPTNLKWLVAPPQVRWHHVVVVYDYTQNAAGEIKFYLDGLPVALTDQGTQRDNASGQFFATDNLWVGARAGASLFAKFYMRHLAVIPGALSAGDVAALYASITAETMKSRVGLAI